MKFRLTSDLKTTLIFFIFGCLWIYVSDLIFLSLVGNDVTIYSKVQTIKGLVFVLFASLLIYYVVHTLHKNIVKANSKLKASNMELNETLERYQMLSLATRDAIRDYNFKTGKTYVNNALMEMFGYRRDEIQDSASWWSENIHERDRPRVLKGLEEAMLTGKIIWQDEYLFSCADGSFKKILDRSHILHDEKGEVYRIIGALQDVTQNRKLQEQLFEQRLAHEKELSQIILSAQERERRRIALELHDNINQLLTTIKLHVDFAKSNAGDQNEILSKIESMMNHAINEVRILSRELAPAGITDLGLSDSIRDMAGTIEKTGRININVDTSKFREEKLSTDKKLTLYRIAQEQLNNIIRYAKAKHAGIRLYTQNDHVQMEIWDDGVGFNVHTLTPGLGFSNMRSRLEVFNGKMHLTSSPGKGCELVVSL